MWRQCNIECTAAVQSVANGWLQLAEQCGGGGSGSGMGGAAGSDWGVFNRHPAVRQAVERETRAQMRRASEAADRHMLELVDCYSTLLALTASLHAAHDQWMNAAASVSAGGQQDWLSCPLFERGSCPLSAFPAMADTLLAMYRKELALKRAMMAHIEQQTVADTGGGSDTRAVLEQYMVCWTLEPFLQAERIEEIGRVWQTECPAIAIGAAT